MRFIVIKKSFNDIEMLINILKNLLGVNTKIDNLDEFLIIYHNYTSDDDIEKVLNSLSDDLMVKLVSYISFYDTEAKSKEELSIVLDILGNNEIPAAVYSFKELLLLRPTIKDKRKVLNLILESTGIDEFFIENFAKNDLNVSKASKAMYSHRNTTIYKLDKLKEISNFDLRSFIDTFIIYSLIKN